MPNARHSVFPVSPPPAEPAADRVYQYADNPPRRVGFAVLLAVVTSLVLPSLANAATFGPFRDARWEIRAFANAGPVTLDLANQQYCVPEARLITMSPAGAYYLTGFRDAPAPAGQCRSVIAAFPAPRGARGNSKPCKLDWRTGDVLSDVTRPIGQAAPLITLPSTPAYVELCVFGLTTDGYWHAQASAGFVAIGPFKLAKPEIVSIRAGRNGGKGRATVRCKLGEDQPSLLPRSNPRVTLRVGSKTLRKIVGSSTVNLPAVIEDKAIKPGVKLTASCEAFSKVSASGDEFPRRASTTPFYTSPTVSKRAPR